MQTNEVLKLDELMSTVLMLLKKYKADRALLFGSYARGEATPDSDIDLVVFGGARFHPTDRFLSELTIDKSDFARYPCFMKRILCNSANITYSLCDISKKACSTLVPGAFQVR